MHYSFIRKMRLLFIDSDLLYRGALKAGLIVQYDQGHTMINHCDGHTINPSVGISPTFSHCDRP